MTSGHHPTSRSPDDQAGHPDLDALADLDAGLLDPATTARLTSHAGGCPLCAGRLGALTSVRADLRSLPPPRLPESVAARLDATLAELRTETPAQQEPDRAGSAAPTTAAGRAAAGEERSQRAEPPLESADAGVEDLAGARERRRDRSRRLTTLVAASVVVLAAIVGTATAVLRQAQDHKLNATAGSALPADQSGRGADRGSGSTPAPQQRVPEAAPGEGPSVGQVPIYTRLTLPAGLGEIEEESTVAMISAAGQHGPGGAMADQTRRTSCSRSIPGTVGPPTAVQQVMFEGTPAFVFVYRDAQLSRRVFVVTTPCGLPNQPATVLYQLPN